ncbi:uncharacterized protein K452DRAFT_57230 [Aplosporella prunicola CBS 121167]|uniref:Uncharacterized protein n=1 Tax=Aplosporella prunicola CBS 121167 TaxID=1176127 RepID=A0A6A6B6W5_9PEZI|nr:uncharacterized protein K452DRAFT_57230 [Aplosporella prunicola CBS 121167]KAF2139882.1 hypothetical protein K452DRAFT_57230 [Aplosporella prunicola CBS 121167]
MPVHPLKKGTLRARKHANKQTEREPSKKRVRTTRAMDEDNNAAKDKKQRDRHRDTEKTQENKRPPPPLPRRANYAGEDAQEEKKKTQQQSKQTAKSRPATATNKGEAESNRKIPREKRTRRREIREELASASVLRGRLRTVTVNGEEMMMTMEIIKNDEPVSQPVARLPVKKKES